MKDILGWLLPAVFIVFMFFMALNENNGTSVTEQPSAADLRLEATQEQLRKNEEALLINRTKELTSPNSCGIEYSSWTTCTPNGTQFRLVTELESGCKIGATSRNCTYTPNPLFDMTMDQIMQLAVEDLRAKGGRFQFFAYNEETGGRYFDTSQLILIDEFSGLSIRRETVDTLTNTVFSDTTMFNNSGNYEPDAYASLFIDEVLVFYVDADPAIKESHLIMWEQILRNYVLLYAS